MGVSQPLLGGIVASKGLGSESFWVKPPKCLQPIMKASYTPSRAPKPNLLINVMYLTYEFTVRKINIGWLVEKLVGLPN